MSSAGRKSRRRGASVVSVPSKAEIARAVSSRAPSMLALVKSFLVSAGMTESDVNEELRAAATRPAAAKLNAEIDEALVWTQLSDAVALWYLDERYLDERGRAVAIPEDGPAPSVAHLLESCVDGELRQRARALLKEHVNINDAGLWLYALEDGALRLQGDAVVERLYLAIARTLASFLFNASFTAPADRKNFDRVSAVSEFPVRMLPALRRRMHQRLAIVIRDVDNWITRQSPTQDEPVCEVAVGAYVFTGDARPRRVVRKARAAKKTGCEGGTRKIRKPSKRRS